MSSIDAWGPWAPGLSACETVARLRCLRALVHVLVGPRGGLVCAYLEQSEVDPTFAPHALAEFNTMGSRDLRSVVASYGALTCPGWKR